MTSSIVTLLSAAKGFIGKPGDTQLKQEFLQALKKAEVTYGLDVSKVVAIDDKATVFEAMVAAEAILCHPKLMAMSRAVRKKRQGELTEKECEFQIRTGSVGTKVTSVVFANNDLANADMAAYIGGLLAAA